MGQNIMLMKYHIDEIPYFCIFRFIITKSTDYTRLFNIYLSQSHMRNVNFIKLNMIY